MNRESTNLTLKNRAKTFYFASLFFPNYIKKDIRTLYEFCRYIDDIGDDQKRSSKSSKFKLEKIKNDLRILKSQNVIVSNLLSICSKYNINTSIPIYLIDGVLSDLKIVNFKSNNELIKYSFKVAGTVGLMMCAIMNVKDKKLKLKAIQLGIAMQITNISRDVNEDLNRGRIYFPKQLLSKKIKDFKEIPKKKKFKMYFCKDLNKLLNMADRIYKISWNGIILLPIKYRIPIAIASFLYQSIGRKIRSKSYDVWNQRIYLNFFEKIIYTVGIIYKLIFCKKPNEDKLMELTINKALNKFNIV